MNNKKYFLLLLIFIILILSCTESSRVNEKSIFVSIMPQKYFIDRITKNTIKTDVMVPPGKSPATYEPLPEQIMRLSKTKVFFTISLPFEKSFLPKIRKNLPSLNVIDCSEGIEKISMEEHHHEENSHDNENNEELDPHIWLSPKLAVIQAETIKNALINIFPENREVYTQGFEELRKDLLDLDIYIKNKLKDTNNNMFFVYHPTFAYFARDYNLKQIAIEQGGKEASTHEIRKIIELARNENIKTIFVQPEFNIKTAGTIAEAIDGRVYQVNPLAYEYISSLKATANALASPE